MFSEQRESVWRGVKLLGVPVGQPLKDGSPPVKSWPCGTFYTQEEGKVHVSDDRTAHPLVVYMLFLGIYFSIISIRNDGKLLSFNLNLYVLKRFNHWREAVLFHKTAS